MEALSLDVSLILKNSKDPVCRCILGLPSAEHVLATGMNVNLYDIC